MSAILLVTRDSAVRQLVQQSMLGLGHEVISSEDAEEAIHAVGSVDVELALLDEAGIPHMHIDSLCNWVRNKLQGISILFLAASPPGYLPIDSNTDRVLQRPLAAESLREAVALALQARAPGPAGDSSSVNGLTLVRATHELTMKGGARVSLTPVQFRLLETLARRHGSIVSPEELLRDVWGENRSDASADLLRSHLHLLRSKLRQSLDRDPIETVPRRGYRLN